MLGSHDYDRYQRFAAEESVLQAGGVLCPQPGDQFQRTSGPKLRGLVHSVWSSDDDNLIIILHQRFNFLVIKCSTLDMIFQVTT